jgi:CheY-like chemotaxis protein
VRLLRKPLNQEVLSDLLNDLKIPIAATVRIRQPKATITRAHAHVLIVEDEQTNAAVAEGYLAELGCSSVWVDSGEVAVARSAVERFDIILMDLNMPRLDGFETTALIRKGERPGGGTIIVAVTANDARQYRESCLAAGMDDILTKPYSLSELSNLLEGYAARWKDNSTETARTSDDGGLSSIDAAAVARLRRVKGQGESDLYPTLVTLFVPSSCATLDAISVALANDDPAGAAAACHKLKASAANVGALAFSASLAELERLCVARDLVAADALFRRLESAHRSLIEQLQTIGARRTA